MNKAKFLSIALLAWPSLVYSQQYHSIGVEAAWEPDEATLKSARESCASLTPPALRDCFAGAMAKAGASAEAVAFTKRHPDIMYVRQFHEAGNLDIVAISRPFRANENDGILIVNGTPAEVDIDDPSRFPLDQLRRDLEYADLVAKHPKAMLIPGDRSSAGAIEAIEQSTGQRFVANYRLVDGCRACPTLGWARFAFDFDSNGKLQELTLIGFSLPGPDGEDTGRAAPVSLDVSSAPRLIQFLYHSTRESKESKVLEWIERARALSAVEEQVKAMGPQGRTALHWVVFGAAVLDKPTASAAYEELAADLIEAGADINQEDQYQNTALDYLDYSPNQRIQSLLLERGGLNGYFTRDVETRFKDMFRCVEEPGAKRQAAGTAALLADLTPGQAIHVRLLTPVGSELSWTGDPIEAVVTTPLRSGARVLLAPGSKIDGTVYYSHKAADKYDQPRLVLDFANVVHPNGTRSPIFVRVASVDNARETIRQNEIIGITQPHAGRKTTVGMRLASIANPGIGWAIEGLRTAYGLSIRREIHFPKGTDLTLQVTEPSRLRELPAWKDWEHLPVDADLERLVERSPMRTATPHGQASDLTNLMFLGSREQLERAFAEAGWVKADGVTISSTLKTFQATVRKSGYEDAPMSTLTIEGQAPDLVFQKGLNTFARRHHLRIWKRPGLYRGREIWISSSTHDIGIGLHQETKWFHRIDPRIDRERTKVQDDLLFSGGATAYAVVERPRAPRESKNATGDKLLTDGRMAVLWLTGTNAVRAATGTENVR